MKRIFAILFVLSAFASAFAQSERLFLFDNFGRAVIYFHTGMVTVSDMNYDAMKGKMYFMQGTEMMELTNADQIDSIAFGDRKFIRKANDFVEVYPLEHGNLNIQWRLKEVHAGYVGALGATTQSGGQKVQLPGNFGMGGLAGAGGGMYNGTFGVNDDDPGGRHLDVWRHHNANVYYFTVKGKEYKVSKHKQLYKYFSDKKDEIEKYCSENHLHMMNADEALKIVDYIFTLYQ